jgi:hypothetical protein
MTRKYKMDKDNTGNSFATTTTPVSESVHDYKHKVKKCDENDDIKEGFYCHVCHYKTSRKSSMDKHLNSKKHKEEIGRMALGLSLIHISEPTRQP